MPYLIGLCLEKLGEDVIVFNEIIIIGLLGLASLAILCISQYALTMILHYTSHKIILTLREDVFSHIQTLSHEQLNNIPVGTLVKALK